MRSFLFRVLLLAGVLPLLTGSDCNRRGVPDAPSRGALRDPDPAAVQLEQTLRQEYPTMAIAWGDQGYVEELSAFLGPLPAIAGDPANAARSFVMNNAALFGIDPRATFLQPVTVQTGTTMEGDSVHSYFIQFEQLHERRPVFDGNVVVSVTASGRPYSVHSALWPITLVAREVKISREDAIERAQRAVKNKPQFDKRVEAIQIVFPVDTSGIPAWQVDVAQWRVVVDGQSGAIHLIRDMALRADARVFRENRSVDNNTTVVLPIGNLTGNTLGTGTRVAIANQAGALTTSAAQQFRDSPGDINFDDQMVYFHMDNAFTFFNGLGFNLPAAPRNASTNVGTSACNAAFQSNTDSFVFGPSSSGCDTDCQSAATFADIIVHETTHRILFTNSGVRFATDESGAIHEGTADYFAASVTGNNCLGEDFVEGRDCLRNSGQFRSYPRHMDSESHEGGRVWASALVDLQELLGKATADRIIAAGMGGLPANPTFAAFAGNIITQGSAFFSNQLGDDAWKNFFLLLQIAAVVEGTKDVFCSHGIAATYGSFVARTIRTPGSGETVDEVLTVPAGQIVDPGRGCRGGFDIIARDGDSWEDLETFLDRRDELEVFTETLNGTSLRVRMRAPGGCGGVPQVRIRYVLYHKQP